LIEPSPVVFLQACGGRAAPLLDLKHRGRGEITRWELPLPFALLGRDERADVQLDDENISHRHAYLQLVSGRLWCVDLGSRNGLRSEHGRISAGILNSQEALRIGDYDLRLVNQDEIADVSPSLPANPLSSEADDLSFLPRIALDFRSGSAREKTWMVDRPLTLVGRAPFCKVRLHSSMVSRVHCALVNTAAGLWVVDLLGREGIYVNGKAVRWAGLEPNDELQIDQFLVRVRFLAPAQRQLQVARSLQTPVSGDDNTSSPRSSSQPSELRPAKETDLVTAGAPALTTPVQLSANALLLPLFAQFADMQQQLFDQFQQSLVLMAQMLGGLQRDQMQLIRQELDQLREITRELQEVQADWSVQTTTARPLPQPIQEESSCQPEGEKTSQREEQTQGARAEKNAETPTPASPDVHLWLAKRLETLQQERQTRWRKILGMMGGK
jgi:pSer/pThr/pTyr-binding forkhead associated (FHA) protein